MEELSEIAKSRCPSSLLSVHMLSSKFRLYKLCLNKSTEYVKTLDSEIGNIFGTVFEEFEDIQKLSFDMLFRSIDSNIRSLYELQTQKAGKTEEKIDVQALLQEKNSIIEQFSKEKEELLAEITSLQEENKEYLDTLIKRTKSNAEISLHKPPQAISLLSKQELKEIITALYLSKAKSDLNQSEGSFRQTLEQHMFSFFAEKYQSRQKSLTKVSEIIQAIKKYSDDIDVLLFAKILRSECDENYRYLHEQVRETIAEMVKEHTKTEEIRNSD